MTETEPEGTSVSYCQQWIVHPDRKSTAKNQYIIYLTLTVLYVKYISIKKINEEKN